MHSVKNCELQKRIRLKQEKLAFCRNFFIWYRKYCLHDSDKTIEFSFFVGSFWLKEENAFRQKTVNYWVLSEDFEDLLPLHTA